MRPGLTRTEAVERARDFLERQGSAWVPYAVGARPNPIQELWIIEPRNPEQRAGEPIEGGSLLVVPFDGPVREIGFHPGVEELIGLRKLSEVAGLPSEWGEVLDDYLLDFDWWHLIEWIEGERASGDVYPDREDVFNAFQMTAFENVRVVILGQDPYHQPGQAHGLCFSVPMDEPKLPPSLRKIHELLRAEGFTPPRHGNLEGWASQGVLMLNTALTVRRSDPGSHAAEWKAVTDAVIQAISDKEEPMVFILWGGPARDKKRDGLIASHHLVIESAHPTSRATANDPFVQSESFTKANRFLKAPIRWGETGATSTV